MITRELQERAREKIDSDVFRVYSEHAITSKKQSKSTLGSFDPIKRSCDFQSTRTGLI